MATWDAMFVYCNYEPTDSILRSVASLIQQTKPAPPPMVRYERNKPWLQLTELSWLEPVSETAAPQYASAISAELRTMVICLYGQTVVDAYGYWSYRNGILTRCLIYGFCEQGIWDRATGTPDIWEDNVLFNSKNLFRLVDGLSEKEADRVKEIWRTKEIQSGSEYPFMNNFDLIKMGIEMNLPGFNKIGKIPGTPWAIECRLE